MLFFVYVGPRKESEREEKKKRKKVFEEVLNNQML